LSQAHLTNNLLRRLRLPFHHLDESAFNEFVSI
jgi:hypothetical protein